jgi:NADPH-dependent 2,4-dienoyl-CoA reductase/sulfur reductase-like enzyme
MVALAERVTDHLDAPAPHLPRERLWQVRAGEVILAAGAIERPLVFPGNDLPGIMLAGAARSYLNRYGVLPGARVAILTAHDEAYRAALDLKAAGVNIVALADLRRELTGALPQAARQAGLTIRTGATAIGTRGNQRVTALGLAAAQTDGSVRGAVEWIGCDAVLMSGGYTPSVHLFSQSRGKLRWDESLQVFVPGAAAENCRCVGACAGESVGETGTGGCRSRKDQRAASPSSTGRTMSRRPTCAWLCARASARSSTSSATPLRAWRPIRARPQTLTRWRSPHSNWAGRYRRSGSRPSGCPITR